MEEQATQWTEKEGFSYKLPLCQGHLPSASTRIKSCANVVVDHQHTLNCVQEVEIRNKAVCSGKTGQNRSLDG